MSKKSALEEPLGLPIKLDPVSNGEFVPDPPSERVRRVHARALEIAFESARRLGISRRDFLRSSSGAAAVLLALNEGCAGGRYAVTEESTLDRDRADAELGGDELVFDVQTHHVETERPWWRSERPNLGGFLTTTPQAQCGDPEWARCFSRDVYLREVFRDSDTDVAVLSALWGDDEINAIAMDEMSLTRDRMAALGERLRIHAPVRPRLHPPNELAEVMEALHREWRVSAWKLYPVWGPDGHGYRLDEDVAHRVVEHGIALGVPLFAIHKGLPLPGQDPSYASALDVGVLARAHPDATFLIYHSGFERPDMEGPYDPTAEHGVDSLVRRLAEQGIGRDGNVYAELGSAWRECMREPDRAAHLLGKLLAHLGPDRILWGTDAIWYGSPQDQIQAFRAFEIAPELREAHRYPELDRATKAKIFGPNAARVYGLDADEMRRERRRDALGRARAEYAYAPDPSFRTYGPRTRREVLSLVGDGH
jgi:predicted TIM-barrel fold metal-dependent hydrolase